MLKPLEDKVIVEKIKEDDKTKSGIVLAHSLNEDVQYVKIYEVGKIDDQKKVKALKGQNVYIKKNTGNQFNYKGKELIIIDFKDILAIDE